MTITPYLIKLIDFNPRSLTGATRADLTYQQGINNFNPRSLTGATSLSSYFVWL